MALECKPGMMWSSVVTVEPYSVSKTTGTGIDGVLLDVYIYHPDRPNQFGGKGLVEDVVKERPFKTHAEADEFCLRHGIFAAVVSIKRLAKVVDSGNRKRYKDNQRAAMKPPGSKGTHNVA